MGLRDMTSLGRDLRPILNRMAFDDLQQHHPEMADTLSTLLATGETPAQIEAHVRARFGDTLVTRQVRAAAEYLQEIG